MYIFAINLAIISERERRSNAGATLLRLWNKKKTRIRQYLWGLAADSSLVWINKIRKRQGGYQVSPGTVKDDMKQFGNRAGFKISNYAELSWRKGVRSKRKVPMDVRNSKVRKQDKFRRDQKQKQLSNYLHDQTKAQTSKQPTTPKQVASGNDNGNKKLRKYKIICGLVYEN